MYPQNPTSKEGLHALLCSYNFVRMFVPNFSTIAAPLYAATRGIIWKGPGSGRSKGTRDFDPDFKWNEILERSLRQLQNALLSAPILAVPNYVEPLFLSVDACLKGEGWVLWQTLTGKEGSLVPVAIHYGSTKYGDAESTWEVTRQEAHAIQSALKDCYDYIAHCHFYLFTDHRNLTFLANSVNRAVIRIRHFMQQFNMTVVHVPGNLNNPADGISRLEKLPTELAGDIGSTAVTNSYEDFRTTSRGTDPIQPGFVSLEESDRVLNPSILALCTTADYKSSCPSEEGCILCHPQMELSYDREGFCEVFFTTSSSPTSHFTHQPETILLLEKVGWDLVDGLETSCYDSREGAPLMTRSQSLKAAEDWNLELQKNMDRASIVETFEDSTIGSEDEWTSSTPCTPGVIKRAQSVSSRLPLLSGDTQICKELACEAPGIIGVSEQATQTTPADFRAVSLDFPTIKDFKAIHNNEEGHHGLAHSYRKLLVKKGSGWAETTESNGIIRNQLKQFIDNCPICQKIRGLQDQVKAKHSFIISRPFIEVSYDFIVFEKPDRHENRYLIVAVDNFTKLVEMKPRPDRGSEGVALFLLELKARYGPINRLRSDREKAFTSQVVKRLNELTGTTEFPCVPYHPQANSVCERQNQIIMNHLRALVYGTKLGPDSAYSWTELLPFVFSIVNNTPKMPLAISPLSMIYGVFANYDQPLLEPRHLTGSSNPVDYTDGLMNWQNRLLEIAEDIQSRHYAKLSLKSNGSRQFQEGDFVLQLKNSTGISGKLVSRWIGPRLVLARRYNDPAHPVLDLYDLVSSKVHEASIEDCRLMKTGWFQEKTMLQDLQQLAALDKEEYEVEEILEHRPQGLSRPKGVKPQDYWFKVKWAGFSEQENSWEPYANLKDLEPLSEYLNKFPLLKL
jgi:hypothetical protein